MEDLAGYAGEWVTPAATVYHGYDISTLPPPAQTWATGELLNILEACVPAWTNGQTPGRTRPGEREVLASGGRGQEARVRRISISYNGDPNFVKVPLDRLLSKEYARSLCGRVDPNHAAQLPKSSADGNGDTIVLSTADRWGNMVAWVNSLYSSFGSGIVVPGYGITLHNRGGLFTLDAASPNAIAPHKRPFNTLSAAFVTQNAQPSPMRMTVTLMGGDMQAQGIAQVLLNVLDLGANVQAATDMARFRHNQMPNVLGLESALFRLVGGPLKAMGHQVESIDGDTVGGYQSILFTPGPNAPGGRGGALDPIKGFYRGGSDHRKDGQAIGY